MATAEEGNGYNPSWPPLRRGGTHGNHLVLFGRRNLGNGKIPFLEKIRLATFKIQAETWIRLGGAVFETVLENIEEL
jgi:hypothetical protein